MNNVGDEAIEAQNKRANNTLLINSEVGKALKTTVGVLQGCLLPLPTLCDVISAAASWQNHYQT